MTSRQRSAANQRGLTTVEFAVVGLLAFIILFGCLEFGRALYTANSLVEATRRGARFAVVNRIDGCQPRIRDVTVFEGGLRFEGLTSADVQVDYLDVNGAVTAANEANIGSIFFVRVSITDYQMTLNIPAIRPTITFPRFETVLPVESLGLQPGPANTRTCSGA